MSISNMTIDGFCDALSSAQPVPGGGAASALCASLAGALGGMVSRLSVGRADGGKKEELCRLAEQGDKLRQRLLELADADAEAFLPLSKAYSIPKDEPGRDERLEQCLKAATTAPMEILELSCEAISLHERLAQMSSPLVVSDVGAGVVLAWGAMYAAAMSVLANTKLMKDREAADKLNGKVDALMDEYWRRADRTYEDVFKLLR